MCVYIRSVDASDTLCLRTASNVRCRVGTGRRQHTFFPLLLSASLAQRGMTAADLVGGYSYFTEISPPLVGTWEERGVEGAGGGGRRTDKVDGVITKRKGKVCAGGSI